MSKLKFTRFKDFKNRWGLDSDLKSEFLHDTFNFFRDTLIEFEDDGLITKYYIEYRLPSGGVDKSTISKNNTPSEIKSQIDSIFNDIKNKASLLGDIKVNDISIYTKIFLPSSQFNDITDILTEIVSSSQFLKSNGFECNVKTSTPEGVKIEVVKKVK